MFSTASWAIEANRYAPYDDYLDVVGYDFTGATFKLQVRDTPNGGNLRADLVPTVSVTTSGGVPTSRISWRIDEVNMEAMPLDPADPSKDAVLFYDMHISPGGVATDKFVPVRGTFTVRAGVTQ